MSIEEMLAWMAKRWRQVVWFFRRLAWWLPKMARWFFWESRVGWLVILAFASVTLLIVPFWCLERQIRILGMSLQLFGFGTVAWGLTKTRKQFNKPTFWQASLIWLKSRPRFKPQHHVISVAGLSVGAAFGRARATVGPGPDTTLERRVEILEQNYESLFKEVGAIDDTLTRKAQELSDAIRTERAEREARDTRIEAQVTDAVAGGLPLDWVGVIYFFIGVIAGTASQEIAALMGGAASCPPPMVW
jgi:hypothetical protein